MDDQKQETPVILIVDDSKVIRRAAAKMLGEGYTVLEAVDGSDAWSQIQQNNLISVVFSDLAMPKMNGMELLENIRLSDENHISSMPLIIMTGHGDTEATKLEVFDKGATDFISKPFESIDLLSRAKSYAKLSRKVIELEKSTGFDKLTGLYNVSGFEESGSKALSFSQRHKLQMTCVYFEIDDFQKMYLDFGKSIAQQILLTVSKRLNSSLRTEDLAARIGVARFAVLLPMTSQAKALIVINRVRASINKLVFDTGDDRVKAVLSCGYSYLDHENDIEFDGLMTQTDDALLRALSKTIGDKVVGFIEADETSEGIAKELNEEQLHQAISCILQGDFYQLHDKVLQPLVEKLMPFIDYANKKNNS